MHAREALNVCLNTIRRLVSGVHKLEDDFLNVGLLFLSSREKISKPHKIWRIIVLRKRSMFTFSFRTVARLSLKEVGQYDTKHV